MSIPAGKAVVVEAEGSSNYPKIVPGAVVLINSSDRERFNGEFFAFRADGNLLIKRLTRMPDGRIMATAENSDFKPKMTFYDERTDDFEVIGRAVWTGVEL
jgi:phage repressor protein C with HTH and peptisase S24 domain